MSIQNQCFFRVCFFTWLCAGWSQCVRMNKNFPLLLWAFLAPGETDVPLLTALLSVRPLSWTAVQQTFRARTIQLALRQSLKDPIVRGLSNYGNLINLFSSSPLTAFVSPGIYWGTCVSCILLQECVMKTVPWLSSEEPSFTLRRP